MPIIIHRVADVRNMTGICQVMIWSKLGVWRPVFNERPRSPLVLASSLRMFSRPSRCDDRRCRRTVWSAAVRMLNSERMMPQYHEVRTDHGDSSPLGRMFGQLPVDVNTPAKRADLWSLVNYTLSRCSNRIWRRPAH